MTHNLQDKISSKIKGLSRLFKNLRLASIVQKFKAGPGASIFFYFMSHKSDSYSVYPKTRDILTALQASPGYSFLEV